MKSKIFFGLIGVLLAGLWLSATPVTLAIAPPLQSAPITAQARTAPLIVDHTTTDITAIPQMWIQQAKSTLHIGYGHTSHGSQLTTGMTGLVNFANNGGLGLALPENTFSWNNGGTGGALDLREYDGMDGDVGYYPQWVNETEAYLGAPDPGTGRGQSKPTINVIIWSWCGQASGYTEQQMLNQYLLPMTQLEQKYPGITFVYMTGHSDGSGETGNLHLRNQQIRQYAIANNKVLFDFYDIELYDPDGSYYGDKRVNDNCDYDSDGNSSRDKNWATLWQTAHTQNTDWYSCSCAHSQSLNCNQKAYAAWWLWARLAGWDGNSGGGDNAAPHMPANPNPADGAANVFFKNNLTWQGGDPDGDPITYTVAFGPVNPPPATAAVTTPLYAPTMTTNTTYYWQITSTDGLSVSVGPTWQFTTSVETTVKLRLPIILKNSASSPPSGHAPEVAGCEVFPADNIWNTPIDALPVDANSAAYINTIGATANLHADFGSGTWEGFPIGIPYTDVLDSQAEVNVNFTYAGESDAGPYPIPPNPPIEGDPNGDGDRHILIVDRDACTLYELYAAHLETDGWYAGSGAIFNLSSHALRPAGWTSADAAGLPILPGLARYDEAAAGEIRHTLRFTAPQTRQAYTWPARHYASELTGAEYPPMGQRFRLKATFDISGYSPQARVILQALKTYGMILADNGSRWYISGAPNEGWDNTVLHELHQVAGSNFEAVDVSSLMINSDSGQAQP